MICQRCRGLLVCETFDDLNIETDSLYTTATRCINCGDIEDAVVRANHLRSLGRTRARPRRMVKKGDVVLSKLDSQTHVSPQ